MEPTTEEEFREALDDLVRSARSQEITVEGGWTCRNGRDGETDYEVQIFRVVKD